MQKTGFDIESCFGVCIYLEWFIEFLSAKTHILELNSEKQKRRPLQQTSARLVPSPLRCLSPVIRF